MGGKINYCAPPEPIFDYAGPGKGAFRGEFFGAPLKPSNWVLPRKGKRPKQEKALSGISKPGGENRRTAFKKQTRAGARPPAGAK